MKPILYTTHCPKCQVLEKKLQKANIDFDICEDISKLLEKGITQAPILEVEGQFLEFSIANKWVGEHTL